MQWMVQLILPSEISLRGDMYSALLTKEENLINSIKRVGEEAFEVIDVYGPDSGDGFSDIHLSPSSSRCYIKYVRQLYVTLISTKWFFNKKLTWDSVVLWTKNNEFF